MFSHLFHSSFIDITPHHTASHHTTPNSIKTFSLMCSNRMKHNANIFKIFVFVYLISIELTASIHYICRDRSVFNFSCHTFYFLPEYYRNGVNGQMKSVIKCYSAVLYHDILLDEYHTLDGRQ